MDYLGIIFDEYTPSVEAQLIRDLISLKSRYDIVVCCEKISYIQKVCLSLNIKCTRNIDEATAFIIYQTQDKELVLPDKCEDPIVRKLFQTVEDNKLISDPERKGPSLKEFGRPHLSNINRLQYRPNGLTVDPAIKLLWG